MLPIASVLIQKTPLLIFTVPSVLIKHTIIKKLTQLISEIRFYSNMLREDKTRYGAFIEEFRARNTTRGKDLAIRNGKIVSKTVQRELTHTPTPVQM